LGRTSGAKGEMAGLSLFILESHTDGVSRAKLDMADSRNYANIEFNDVVVSPDALLGSQGSRW
jgi:alkylation response protein AidB-like acyl-CoA dehydrogenase